MEAAGHQHSCKLHSHTRNCGFLSESSAYQKNRPCPSSCMCIVQTSSGSVRRLPNMSTRRYCCFIRRVVQDQSSSKPTVSFLAACLRIQLDVLTKDRSVHDGNFILYVDALTRLQWLFHALDHQNYARAVASHLRDLITLREKQPDIYAAFCEGKVTVKKSCRPFSRMAWTKVMSRTMPA